MTDNLTMQASTALSPEWDRRFDEAFAELVSNDPDLVQAEFDALVNACWNENACCNEPPPPPTPPAPSASPPAGPHIDCGARETPAHAAGHRPGAHVDHQRSPP